MKKSVFKELVIFLFFTLLIFQYSNANALLQQAGSISIDATKGGKSSFTWLLQSDDEEPITLKLSAEGTGSEFLIMPQTIQIEPNQTVLVPVDVVVPSDYSGQLSLSPTLVATKSGDAGESTIINLQLSKTVTISIKEIQDDNITINDVSSPEAQTEIPNQTDQIKATVSIEQKDDAQTDMGGGCLIATAAYGTELAPQVQILREIRDNVVLETKSGATFMAGFNQAYYSFSPVVADWERQNFLFKEFIRLGLSPMLLTLSILSLVEDGSENQFIWAGTLVIILNMGLYVVAPIMLIHKIRKKF